MLQRIKYLILLCLCIAASHAMAATNNCSIDNAESGADCSWYDASWGSSLDTMQGRNDWTIGFDVEHVQINPRGEWGTITYASKTGAEVYLAYRPFRIWGIELGYSWTNDTPKDRTISGGTIAWGAPSSIDQVVTGKIRYTQTYIDIWAHQPISKCIEFKAGLGVGFMRERVILYSNTPQPGDPVQNAILEISARATTTYRFNVGAQWLMTKRIGLRSIFTYQTTSQINLQGTITPPVDTKLCANSYSILLGIYWNFYGYYWRD